jgi:hypothetical protein
MRGRLAPGARFTSATAFVAEVSDTDDNISLEQIDPFEMLLMQITDFPARTIFNSE